MWYSQWSLIEFTSTFIAFFACHMSQNQFLTMVDRNNGPYASYSVLSKSKTEYQIDWKLLSVFFQVWKFSNFLRHEYPCGSAENRDMYFSSTKYKTRPPQLSKTSKIIENGALSSENEQFYGKDFLLSSYLWTLCFL